MRLSELSSPRQVLVRICQSLNFGQILNLNVCGGEPMYAPEPTVLVDIKLDSAEGRRPDAYLADFTLPEGMRRLLGQLDALGTGTIETIEVRSGVPRRIVLRSGLQEARR